MKVVLKKKSRFSFFLNVCHHKKFWKNIMNRFCENFVLLYFWPKNIPFLKCPNNHCYPFFNACHQVQFQANLIHRFKEKVKNVKFGPKK